jgi:hypothetical protein
VEWGRKGFFLAKLACWHPLDAWVAVVSDQDGGAMHEVPLNIHRHHRACPGDPRLAFYFG